MRIIERLLGVIDAFGPADGPPPQTLIAFLRWALAGSGRGLALGVAVSVTLGTTELVAAYFTRWAIDLSATMGPGNFSALLPFLGLAALFFIGLRPLIFAADSSISNILLGPHLFPLVLSRLNRHTLGHSLRFFENDFAGRISQKAIQTARAVSDIVVEFIDVVVYTVAMFIGALVLLASIDGRMLIVFAGWFVIWAAYLRHFIPRVRQRSAERAEARTNVSGQIVDAYSNITTVKLFAHDTFEDRAALKSMERFRQKAVAFGMTSAQFRFGLMTLGGTLPLFTLSTVLYLWSIGVATAGDIALVAMVATRLSQITNRVSMAAVSIFANIGEISDGIATLTPVHEITNRPNARDELHAQGAIEFDNITFRYGAGASALNGLSLRVAPGEKVALVGASGAGKSTVISLLLRLYDVTDGRVLLDGHDIRDLTQTALRRQIAVVRQETAMFNRSARDNIRYGHPDASDEEVYDAARRASAHDFILNLEDFRGRRGYDAFLGERGVKLSGGQRQRIALARAILKDAPILVLDEATSALDSEVEAEIQSALIDVMAGKTVIAIAHRLSTIAAMDRIIVIEGGQIVEQGTHQKLLKQNGAYARYWSHQSGGFIAQDQTAD